MTALSAIESREVAAAASPGRPMDEAAFAAFYAETSRGLWAYLRRLSGDPALADDVLQESYLKFLRNHDPSHDERETRGYLYRIATTVLHDRWRSAQRERTGLARIFSRRHDPVAAGDLPAKLDVEAALARLKPRDRAILWLAHVEGWSHREIAQILDLKEASVRVLLFRARGKLVETLR